MNTTADLTDTVTVHVPSGIPTLVVRLPLLESAAVQDTDASDNLQLAGKERIISSVKPSHARSLVDSAGNVYQELTYTDPPAGNMTIQANIGQVNLTADLDTPIPGDPLPIAPGDVPSDVSIYLVASPYVQSNSPEIQQLASSIVGNAPTEAVAASRIAYWLRTNLSYGGYDELQGNDALSTLHNHASICCGWAHLFLALARASGIPARFVGGYVIGGHITYPMSADGNDTLTMRTSSLMHAWVELWYPHEGWVAYDPQASDGFVDTHHIRLWASVDGGGTLPLVTWESIGNTPDVSFTESESAENVSDQVDICYRGDDGDPSGGAVIFSRPTP